MRIAILRFVARAILPQTFAALTSAGVLIALISSALLALGWRCHLMMQALAGAVFGRLSALLLAIQGSLRNALHFRKFANWSTGRKCNRGRRLEREHRRERRERFIFCALFAPFVLPSGNRFRQIPHPRPAHTEFLGHDAHRFLQSLGRVP